MRFIIAFALIATLMAVSAYPQVDVPLEDVEEEPVWQLEEEPEALSGVVEESHRVKRATCDLLSGFGWNHAPCAIHCNFLGKKGGYCNGQGVCVCRN